MTPLTTGELVVPVCLVHKAKPEKHKAKSLPCAAHGKAHKAKQCMVMSSLSCAKYRGARQCWGRHHHHLTMMLDVDGGLPTSGSHRSLFAMCKHTAKRDDFINKKNIMLGQRPTGRVRAVAGEDVVHVAVAR